MVFNTRQTQSNNGLTIILTVVTFIFLIGLVIFIFVLFGDAIIGATSETGTGAMNESIILDEGGYSTSVAGFDGVQLSNVQVYECTPDCVELPPSNYTINGGVIYRN